nr:conjugative transfer relaxase/helicase TraI domain-containing protein [Escherichia coli]
MPLTMPQKGTAHDVLEPKPDREVANAQRLFSTARTRDVAAGRASSSVRAGRGAPARLYRDVNIRSRRHCRRLTVTASPRYLAEPTDHG